MKTADQWFDEYAESHQNPTNKTIHWICVPLIFMSIYGILASIPHAWLDAFFPENIQPFINYGTILLLIASIFYVQISVRLLLGLWIFTAAIIALYAALDSQWHLMFWGSLTIFVLAWVGQFIGHNIEGKKPSFLKDLAFLLVGPAWLMHFIYKKLGIKY